MKLSEHQTIWFQCWNYWFYFWNQFRILLYSNLHKSSPWKLNLPPKSCKSQSRRHNAWNRSLGADIAPVEDHWFTPILENRSPETRLLFSQNHGIFILQATLRTVVSVFLYWVYAGCWALIFLIVTVSSLSLERVGFLCIFCCRRWKINEEIPPAIVMYQLPPNFSPDRSSALKPIIPVTATSDTPKIMSKY